MDDSVKGRYNIMLGRYLLTKLGLNLKLSDHIVEAGGGSLKGETTPMVHLVTYEFKNKYRANFT